MYLFRTHFLSRINSSPAFRTMFPGSKTRLQPPHSDGVHILLSYLPTSSARRRMVAHIDAFAPRDEHVACRRCSLICIHVGAYVIHVFAWCATRDRAERVKTFVFLSFLLPACRVTWRLSHRGGSSSLWYLMPLEFWCPSHRTDM